MLCDLCTSDSLNLLSVPVLRGTVSSSSAARNDRMYSATANSPRQRTTSQSRCGSKILRWVCVGADEVGAMRRRYNALRKEMRPCWGGFSKIRSDFLKVNNMESSLPWQCRRRRCFYQQLLSVLWLGALSRGCANEGLGCIAVSGTGSTRLCRQWRS